MKGSMTIEAVLVISLLMLIIMWLMWASIDLYQQTVETAGIDWVNAEGAPGAFRKSFFLRELLK